MTIESLSNNGFLVFTSTCLPSLLIVLTGHPTSVIATMISSSRSSASTDKNLRQIDCSLISGSSIIKGWSEPSSLQSPPQCGEWWSPSLLNSSIPAVSTARVSPEFYDNSSPPQTASSAATDSLSYLQGQVSFWPWTLAGSCCCIYHGSSLSATSSLHITHNIHSHL